MYVILRILLQWYLCVLIILYSGSSRPPSPASFSLEGRKPAEVSDFRILVISRDFRCLISQHAFTT